LKRELPLYSWGPTMSFFKWSKTAAANASADSTVN
jgi:hypothetical protein